jgi:hypothetical protein
MIEARADGGDGGGRQRCTPELPHGLVEELSRSGATRSLVDAMSGAIASPLEGLIPKGPDLTHRMTDLFPMPKAVDFLGQIGRDTTSPLEGLIPKGPDLTRRMTDLFPMPKAVDFLGQIGRDTTSPFEGLFPMAKGPDFLGQIGRDTASPLEGLFPKGPDLTRRFDHLFAMPDLMKPPWASAGSVFGPDFSAGSLAGLSSSLMDGVGGVFVDHRRWMDELLGSVAPSVVFGDTWLGRVALRVAVSAKQAVLRGDVDAVRWFVQHWLNFRRVPATLVDAASTVLLDESAWMPAEDVRAGYDPCRLLRALTIAPHRHHRMIGDTQLCGRRVWSLDEPVRIGSGDVSVPRVELVASPPPPCDEIRDPRLIRLFGALSERERMIVWAWINEGSWAAAAESCGATRAEANNVRRKVNRLVGSGRRGFRGD